MILAHKIALDPNDVQEAYFRKAAGIARFAYNWALAEWQRQYEAWKADPTGSKPSDPALRKQLNAIKGDQFPWMLEVTKNAPQMAIMQLGQAFKNFLAGTARQFYLDQRPIHGQRAHRAYSEVRRGSDARIVTLCRENTGRHDLPDRRARVFECHRRDARSAPYPSRKPSGGRGRLGRCRVGHTLDRREDRGTASLCNRLGPASSVVETIQSPEGSRQSACRASARRTHSERNAHPLVEEHAGNPTAHRPAACPDCEYPRECLAPVDHDARGAV